MFKWKIVLFSGPSFSTNKATVYFEEVWLGFTFFAYEHVVLIGELKMLACGLCMAAYKKRQL